MASASLVSVNARVRSSDYVRLICLDMPATDW